MNQILSHAIASVISFTLGILSSPIKDWFYSTEIGQCTYKPDMVGGKVEIHEVNICKRYGKVRSVNCPWFNKRETRKNNGKEYKYCHWGINGVPDRTEKKGGFCRFMR